MRSRSSRQLIRLVATPLNWILWPLKWILWPLKHPLFAVWVLFELNKKDSDATRQLRTSMRRDMVKLSKIFAAALTVVAVTAGAFMLIWRGPWWFDAPYLSRDNLRPSHAALISGFRAAIVQILVALGAGIALFYTARTYRLSVKGQATDRFTKALERLSSEDRYVRLGGIYAFHQIIEDSPDQANFAAAVLNAYLHEHAPAAGADRPSNPTSDVQAVLTALTLPRSAFWVRKRFTADPQFSGLHLVGAKFAHRDLTSAAMQGADLSNAQIRNCWLDEANLAGANLSGAQIQASCLSANFSEANLTRVELRGDFRDARFDGANLTEARIQNSDLGGAYGLTARQICAAFPTRNTTLPAELVGDESIEARIEQVEEEIRRYYEQLQSRTGP